MRDAFTQKDLDRAVNDLSMMPFFPVEARAAIMAFLARICPHKRALTWLVAECVNHVPQWPGPAELRGLLCTRFDAADGIDAYCNLPGYTAAEMESRHIEKHEQLKASGWEQQAEERFKEIAGPVKLRQIGAAHSKERVDESDELERVDESHAKRKTVN